ncbi:hypothetical protein HMPREF9151_02591 [Hoylesella saccharolytica F0055]|uniref:Uncharacterized protein n=1 Tax=Hoylesella saccharolytica F0055 TaxID=1127699 RepID=L1MXT5_9BACT|nr:hypothetical protein HMPREF9151_02591 [Hoylesella saccharolytica F0055]
MSISPHISHSITHQRIYNLSSYTVYSTATCAQLNSFPHHMAGQLLNNSHRLYTKQPDHLYTIRLSAFKTFLTNICQSWKNMYLCTR